MTDEDYWELYSETDCQDALLHLFSKYQKFIEKSSRYPFKNYRTSSDEQEELEAELNLFFLEVLPAFDETRGTFKVFIENKLRNKARKWGHQILDKKKMELTGDELMETLENKEEAEMDYSFPYVEELILRLPKRQRQIARMKILENKRLFQIAEILYPETNKKTRHSTTFKNYQEALKKLERWLEE